MYTLYTKELTIECVPRVDVVDRREDRNNK
jgi:hypothetical protein